MHYLPKVDLESIAHVLVASCIYSNIKSINLEYLFLQIAVHSIHKQSTKLAHPTMERDGGMVLTNLAKLSCRRQQINCCQQGIARLVMAYSYLSCQMLQCLPTKERRAICHVLLVAKVAKVPETGQERNTHDKSAVPSAADGT